MDLVEEDILMHYVVKRRSGRYPWGSGDNPYQHGGDFLARVEELQRLGKTEKQIAVACALFLLAAVFSFSSARTEESFA